MEENKYKLRIKQTIDAFEEIEVILHTCIINLAMEGELKEVNNIFELDEEVSFKISDFSSLTDSNINLLLNIYKEVEQGKSVFQNLFQ